MSTVMDSAPAEYRLTADDLAALQLLVKELNRTGDDPIAPEFYDRNWTAPHHLPVGLGRFLGEFRRTEPGAACLVHGFPVDDADLGPTPGHWSAPDRESELSHKIYLAICAMALGEPFTWLGQQDNHLIMNIVPIQGDERNQSGHGSQTLLEFHTEDGFNPHRCDYLLLLGLRNHDQVPTILASVRDLDLKPETRTILAQDRFHILPDHERIRQLAAYDPDHPVLAGLRQLQHQPPPVAVLYGNQLNPYLRIDRPFMTCIKGDLAAERALDELMDELTRVQQDVIVEPGSLLVVDNHLAVHGRRPFHARYDGTDRWLKKLTVSRNLRRNATTHRGASHRILP